MTKTIPKAAAAKPAKEPKEKAIKKPEVGQPKWDAKKIAVGQWLSYTTYEKVKKITPKSLTTVDSFGQELTTTDWKSNVAKMDSADHFYKEVQSTMTQLAEILQTASDSVFTVSFHRKLQADTLIEKLKDTKLEDLKNAKQLLQFSKSLIEGELCTMRCILIKSEDSLGRSTVIDLDATTPSKFRQVDHRTIQYIILRNVKYVQKKSGKKVVDDEEAVPKWDVSKIQEDNWLSNTQYFKITNLTKTEVQLDGDDVIAMSHNIVNEDMYSAGLYSSEEKLSMTKVSQILEGANKTCFTVCFTTKVDSGDIQARLATVKAAELKEPKALVQELLVGKESTVIGHLTQSEKKLGRSLVIDLPSGKFKQVDHRTIKWLVFKDVKYIVN